MLDKDWYKFKKEFPSILFMSILQIWWNFNFPVFIRLGAPWSMILPIGLSIFGVAITIFLFSNMDELAPYLKLEHINNSPYPSTSKKLNIVVQITMAFLAMFFVWYKDFYGMSNLHYIFLYGTWLVMYFVIYRAVYR